MNEHFSTEKLIQAVTDEAEFSHKIRRLNDIYLYSMFADGKCKRADQKRLAAFLLHEMRLLLSAYEGFETHRQKDEVFRYGEMLMGIGVFLMGKRYRFQADEIDELLKYGNWLKVINVFAELASDALDKERIEEGDVSELISCVKKVDEEYYRSKLYRALLQRKKAVFSFSDGAKKVVADFLAAEAERYLQKETFDEDVRLNFTLLAQTGGYFYDERLQELLRRAMEREERDVAFYAFRTLALNGCCEEKAAESFARELPYAWYTLQTLKSAGKEALFPKDCISSEYLVKSELTFRLIMPSCLGKEPDEMQFFATVNVGKRDYNVFKFKSDSGNLAKAERNEWLLGWTNPQLDMCSYVRMSACDGGSTQKTLKILKKFIR